MGIIANKNTRIICQGILTPQGLSHTEQSIAYGSNIVGGVALGKSGEKVLNIPLFDNVTEAMKATSADVSVIYASPTTAAAEIEEAIKAQVKWIVCTTERILVHDMLRIKKLLEKSKSRLIGPASAGLITAGECKIGTMPAHLVDIGTVGIISRSSSIMYEGIQQLRAQGLGISTCVSLGAYPILGSDFISIFELFQKDKKTKAVLAIGEIGGSFELELARYYQALRRKKPLISYIVGTYVSPHPFVGNIGAIVMNETQTAAYKNEVLKQAGSVIVDSPAHIGSTVFKVLTQVG